jgi:hypothetical protein
VHHVSLDDLHTSVPLCHYVPRDVTELTVNRSEVTSFTNSKTTKKLDRKVRIHLREKNNN